MENTSDIAEPNDAPPAKKQKTGKESCRAKRGQNKSRPYYKEVREIKLCKTLIDGDQENAKNCKFSNCIFIHEIDKYLQEKAEDIGTTCYIYSTRGYCPYGVSCRFAGCHLDTDGKNMKSEKFDPEQRPRVFNQIAYDLQNSLRKKKYNFDISNKIVAEFEKLRENKKEKRLGCTPDDTDATPTQPHTKKSVDFRNKLFLSPLTTVGNLPFRRICKEYGADVTCGEMACAIPIVNGASQEWALTKKHESEDIFGVQICGHKSNLLTYASQLLQENAEIDFIDLNLGCPIDMIYQQGGGSALLRRLNVLQVIIGSCSRVLGDIPFTVKTRTGIYSNKNVAHEMVPKFEEWGASLVTVHGRSREQRYTKTADWEYIEQCAQQAKNIPVIGNGDILTYEDYAEARQTAKSISGCMIGRGALIKPWIFQEIKEEKTLDPSSKDRFEMLQKYVNYGLEHWGSDNKGVENTRKFLLEWQSFLYRYAPAGIMQTPRQRMNTRPEVNEYRDEMEKLMASGNCADWIKLSEMLLGRVPTGFEFLPKHKANSY